MNPILIKAIEARPEGFEGLAPLSCDIVQGERVVVLGPSVGLLNSILKMLGALQYPEHGEVLVLDKSTASLTPAAGRELRKEIGYVLEGGPLLSVVNGLLNLMLAARYHRMGDEKELTRMAGEFLAGLPDPHLQGNLPAFMSERLRRTLAIARALMLKPRALFIENPLRGLNYADCQMLCEYLQMIHGKYLSTTIISTDNLKFTRQFAQKILYCDRTQVTIFDSWQALAASNLDSLSYMFEQQQFNHHD